MGYTVYTCNRNTVLEDMVTQNVGLTRSRNNNVNTASYVRYQLIRVVRALFYQSPNPKLFQIALKFSGFYSNLKIFRIMAQALIRLVLALVL